MSNSVELSENGLCLCGTGLSYGECCLPFHDKRVFPQTAEQLMRSRYSAYALHLKTYVLDTWNRATRPAHFEFEQGLCWHQLIINGRKKGREKDQEGWVTFTALYQLGPDRGQMQEKSHFVRDEEGAWSYVDGELK